MKTTIENLSGLERKLNVVIPAERIEKEVQKKLRKLALKVKMPGFRPGKVPLSMVQKNYGNSVRVDVVEKLVRETCIEAIRKEGLEPVSMPKVEIISAEPNEPFSYSAIFEVYPEINLADFSQIKVEKNVSKLTDNDVNETLEKLRKEFIKWEEITEPSRKSQAGDQLTVDFTVKVVGSKDEEANTKKDIKFVLGDGSMWPDFEKHLYDVGIEKKKYNLQFPEVHVDKELAGKDAEFEVEIRKICQPILPPLDDEFAKKFSIKDGSLEGLKSEIRKKMECDLQVALKNSFKHSIMSKLLDNNPIEIPKSLLEHELSILEQVWKKNFSIYQKTAKQIPEFQRENFIKQAERNVSLGFLLSAVIKENKIQVNPKELRTKVEYLASIRHADTDADADTDTDTDKIIEQYYSDRDRLAEVQSLLLEEKAIDYIASKVDLIDKEISYKEALEIK